VQFSFTAALLSVLFFTMEVSKAHIMLIINLLYLLSYCTNFMMFMVVLMIVEGQVLLLQRKRLPSGFNCNLVLDSRSDFFMLKNTLHHECLHCVLQFYNKSEL
jgi:hypothetical protein